MNKTYTPGDKIHGFTVTRAESIPELQAEVVLLSHDATGAEYMHLSVADDNNLFGIAFRTPPADSTGIAHILEHTVLCGSRKFPVRDPFFSMIKRSLSTFMNALTADDWTMYPFSTRNRKDFYNLLDVYLDAVFFPNLREQDFRQEGHRLEFETPDDPASPLQIKGVVYNEMKGAMSDPRSIMGHAMAKALFPTSTYGYNSGGEPSDIPNLTWRMLRDFHSRYYHPGNARMFTYGNMPLEDHLREINGLALSRFSRATVDSAVREEPKFVAPREIVEKYAVPPGGDYDAKCMVQTAWLMPPLTDDFEVLAANLLSALLLGNPAAPLYKALMDSRLGSQLAPGTGYSDSNKQTHLAAGLQGVRFEDAPKVAAVIDETLERLAREGFPGERVEAALHRMEFANREVTGDHFPYPLWLYFRAIGLWNHDGDPVKPLKIEAALERLRKEAADDSFIKNMIRRHLLENPHRVTLTLVPDTGKYEAEARENAEHLAKIKADMTPEETGAVVSQAVELQRMQEEEPDLACLPKLGLSDIPVDEAVVKCDLSEESGIPVEWYDQPTNGISSVAFSIDASAMPDELVEWVPFFCATLTQVGAAGMGYERMAERMEAVTGGIRASADIVESASDFNALSRVVEFKAKCLERNHGPMFGVLSDVFRSPDFTDIARLRTLTGQIATSLENSIPQSGHRYAAMRAARGLVPGAAMRETWSGLTQVRRMKELAAAPDGALAEVAKKLERIAAFLGAAGMVRCAVAGRATAFADIRGHLAGFLQGVRAISALAFPQIATPGNGAKLETWAGQVAVSYVARAFRTVPYNHPDTPALLVLAKLLKFGYLHREIREKGGAYGGMAAFSSGSGIFSMMSYRDPQLARTLSVYGDAADWAASGAFTDENIEEAVLGVFSDMDSALAPEGKAMREYRLRLYGITPDMRMNLRRGALAVTKDALADAARRYLVENAEGASAVVSGREAIEAARAEPGLEGVEVREI
ncbi:MAG: insulinase family protein [Nitrospirae bacterium]|nr:insulinase family protein [Nitrospirota bacterium]